MLLHLPFSSIFTIGRFLSIYFKAWQTVTILSYCYYFIHSFFVHLENYFFGQPSWKSLSLCSTNKCTKKWMNEPIASHIFLNKERESTSELSSISHYSSITITLWAFECDSMNQKCLKVKAIERNFEYIAFSRHFPNKMRSYARQYNKNTFFQPFEEHNEISRNLIGSKFFRS